MVKLHFYQLQLRFFYLFNSPNYRNINLLLYLYNNKKFKVFSRTEVILIVIVIVVISG